MFCFVFLPSCIVVTDCDIFFAISYSLKDKVKKLTTEKEALEIHLKNEKDEKELYKVIYYYF